MADNRPDDLRDNEQQYGGKSGPLGPLFHSDSVNQLGQIGDRISAVARHLRNTRPPLPGRLDAARVGVQSRPKPPNRPAARPPLPTTPHRERMQPHMQPGDRAAAQASLAPTEPVNICWLARSSRGHIVQHERFGEVADGFGQMLYPLPDALLALVNPAAALIMLNARLFPTITPQAAQAALLQPGALGGGMMERLVEGSRVARLVVALAWLRWHQWPELTAAQLGARDANALNLHDLASGASVFALTQPYAVGWGIAYGPGSAHIRERVWTHTHPATYTLLWKRLAQLLAPRRQLDAQSQLYLGLRPGQPMRAFEDRRPLVWEVGRARGATGRVEAEEMYLRDLAERSRVPEALIRSRLEGDWEVGSLDVWCGISDALVRESGQLTVWRNELATRYGLPDARAVTLFMHEPALLLAGPDGELMGAPERRPATPITPAVAPAAPTVPTTPTRNGGRYDTPALGNVRVDPETSDPWAPLPPAPAAPPTRTLGSSGQYAKPQPGSGRRQTP